MLSSIATLLALSTVFSASAKQVVVTVGKNTTDNATAVFDPAEIFAKIGDVVFFNFTEGNHTVTQSSFGQPCVPLHDTGPTVNSFDSGFRDTDNGTAITNMPVTITTNDTIWFFDYNTCASGGVGGININDSSTATLDGFARNAIRLNGTESDTNTSSSDSASGTSSSSSSHATGTTANNTSNRAERAVVLGLAAVLPLAAAGLLL